MIPESHHIKQAGSRLDRYLVQHKMCTSRSEAARLIKDGFIQVNKKQVRPSHQVRTGDHIAISKPPLKTTNIVPQKVPFQILFEDHDILVLNKPVGLVVHPGAGNYDKSLVHGLLYHCKDLSGIGGVERPGIVHRLDKGTSGVMVVAKNDLAHQCLSGQFKDRTVKKEYVALCVGTLSFDEKKLVHLMKRAKVNRKKFVVNQKKGKRAVTYLRVLGRGEKVSLVSVKPETGRTHQIRVHLSYIGHPILGDEIYGGTKKLEHFSHEEKKFVKNLGRPLLHACQLGFTHPRYKKLMIFDVPAPEDFKKAMDLFLH